MPFVRLSGLRPKNARRPCYRPRLLPFEDRLPPGDALLGPLGVVAALGAPAAPRPPAAAGTLRGSGAAVASHAAAPRRGEWPEFAPGDLTAGTAEGAAGR